MLQGDYDFWCRKKEKKDYCIFRLIMYRGKWSFERRKRMDICKEAELD